MVNPQACTTGPLSTNYDSVRIDNFRCPLLGVYTTRIFDIGHILSTTVRRDGRRICVFKGEKLVSVKLIWKWGGGRTCGSGHNGSDSFSTPVGFILNLRVMRYADFPPQSRHAANPEPKNSLIIIFGKCPFHMKRIQKKKRVLEP